MDSLSNLLTVALPLWKAKPIAWLALESLCRQETTTPWELVIAEENDPGAFGPDALADYEERLFAAGCTTVYYKPLSQWIPLGEKWRVLAEMADPASLGFLLQAADCYSPPRRLEVTGTLLRGGADWVQGDKHILYDLRTRKTVLYDARSVGQTGSDMATRTKYARQLPPNGPRRYVDKWLLDNVKSVASAKSGFRLAWDPENWHHALNVNGTNTISDRAAMFAHPSGAFSPYPLPLDSIVPHDVAERLRCA